ncbi:trypsin-like [Anopheles nili]|uniref:trypsin-like n=1 Tax=Anopheles nili TaxID=185578 RepID=UPI00237B70A9|nr:trypsin-like [Anopheles nili]
MNAKVALLVTICGLLARLTCAQHRQIGGKDVTVQEFPFVVAITYERELCGHGAILDRRWILSSASSFYNQPYSEYNVAVATDDIEGDASWHEVDNVFLHPEWVGWDYNIALVKLKDEVTYSGTVQPINIPNDDSNIPLDVTMLSYGKNEDGTSHLRGATYTLKTDESCLSLLSNSASKDVITEGHGFCLIPPEGSEQGQYFSDAGAPVVKGDELYGVFAFSEDKGGVNKASVATRVRFFADWIQSSIANNS